LIQIQHTNRFIRPFDFIFPFHEPGGGPMKQKLRICWMILLIMAVRSWAQETVQVRGLVLDEEGRPMAAANVLIKELGIGGATNTDGKYDFMIPSDKSNRAEVILQVSYMGYQTQKFP